MTELTNTQKTILETAATRPDGAIQPLPERIRGGAAAKVIKALMDKGLIQDIGLQPPFQTLVISDMGYRAIGQEPPEDQQPEEATEEAQDAAPDEPTAESEPDPLNALFEKIALDHFFIDTLETRKSDSLDFHNVSVWAIKSALEAAYQAGSEAAGKTNRKNTPRANSKQARMIAMMKRPEGATIDQIAEETGWSANTIRGSISGGLKKRLGLNVTTERLRYVGPNAKGGYVTYRIAEG